MQKVDEAEAHCAAIGEPHGTDAHVSLNHRVETAQGEENMATAPRGWCPSIAWMNGLGSVVSHLLLKPVAKVRGHTIAQHLFHSPHMVRQTCCHSWCDRLPLLG
jgi:hypothetical protein